MTTPRLLFVHAHPDDESSKGSGTAARYVDAGAEVVLVTCTGGEAGEVLNPKADDVPPEEMAFVRQAELAAATKIIGFTRIHQLGYRDSGYHEDPSGIPEGSFARLPIDEPSGALARLLRTERPHVVVTYPTDGGYPHPDHIMVHEVTMRAVELAADPAFAPDDGEPWDVPKIYACTAFAREKVLALHHAMLDQGMESPFEGWMERHAERAPEEIGARINVGNVLDRRDDALRAHVTQVDPEGFWFAVPRDLERRVFPHESFIALRRDASDDVVEDDLFAGLDLDR